MQFYTHNRLIGLLGRVFANGLGDSGSIPCCVVPKTLKMVLDTSLLNTQQYEVCIKSKVEQSRERSSIFPLHLSVVAIEKGAFWLSSTTVANFTLHTQQRESKLVGMRVIVMLCLLYDLQHLSKILLLKTDWFANFEHWQITVVNFIFFFLNHLFIKKDWII